MPTLEQVHEGETVTLKDGSEAQVLMVNRHGSIEVILGTPGQPQRFVAGERDDEIDSLELHEDPFGAMAAFTRRRQRAQEQSKKK
jgi:hypothetical protein